MSHAPTDTAFSIERMSFGGGVSAPDSATPAPPAAAAEEVTANRLLRQLADDIARAMGTALRELDRQRQSEGSHSSQKLADRIEFLAGGLDQVRQKAEQLVTAVSEQGSSVRTAVEKCDVLAARLQQAEGAREDLAARVIAVVERLERHGEALRGFIDFRDRVTGALEQVAGVVACLQDTTPPPASLQSL